MKGKKATVDLIDLMSFQNQVSVSFFHVYKALFPFVAIPFSVATVERPFPNLKFIKT